MQGGWASSGGYEPGLVRDIHGYLVPWRRLALIDAGDPRILAAGAAFVTMEVLTRTPCEDGVNRFSRQDVVRILHLELRELAQWERAGLVTAREEYGFRELGELRTLRDLRARRISARKIRAALDAMHRSMGMRSALREVSPARGGAKLRFRHQGALLDPLTQQMVFDFEMNGARPELQMRPAGPSEAERRRTVQEMFLQAVRSEEREGTGEAIAIYHAILELRPQHAPTLINLGTIRYNQRDFPDAERLYRRATEADPTYALAFFDLGNVLDELQRLPEATLAYGRAVTLVPQYADAHYNLALALERQGQRRRALRHWLVYSRLDPTGPWSAHARKQARRTLKAEKLSIVSRRGRLVQAG